MTEQQLIDYLRSKDRADDLLALLQKLGFTTDFVAKNVLSAGPQVTIAHIAMLWMGMPNKHDRKKTHQLLDALSEAGLLSPKGDDETWIAEPRSE